MKYSNEKLVGKVFICSNNDRYKILKFNREGNSTLEDMSTGNVFYDNITVDDIYHGLANGVYTMEEDIYEIF